MILLQQCLRISENVMKNMEFENESEKSSFILYFQVKSSALICDGNGRKFCEIFECVQNQWTRISNETKNSFKNDHFKTNISVEEKCQEFYQNITEKLECCKDSQFVVNDEKMRVNMVLKFKDYPKKSNKMLFFNHNQNPITIMIRTLAWSLNIK